MSDRNRSAVLHAGVDGGGTNFNLTLTGASFTNNGNADDSSGGDIKLFEFLGDAALNNVTVNGEGSNAAHGIQISGYASPGPAIAAAAIGTVSLNTVTVGGDYDRTLMTVQGYTDLAGLTFVATTIGSATRASRS